MTYLAVALGGAIGAVARYGLSGWIQALTGSHFPWGTLLVNVAGSFVIGAALHLATDPILRLPIACSRVRYGRTPTDVWGAEYSAAGVDQGKR